MSDSGDSPLASARGPINGFTQGTRLLKLITPLGADQLLAECVRGEEGIGQGFGFHIAALSTDAGISLRSLIGQPGLLEILSTKAGAARPFHGHITRIELSGADGGFARYHLVLEPWTTFLGKTRDSRVFQDMSVLDILDVVFARYQGQGKLVPLWRFEVADRAIYPKRSLTTQYQESDLAFALRLMSEEGLFHFFRHSADADSPSLGSHELVIADHNGAFQPNAQANIRFTQPGAVMREDSIDRWRSEARLQTNGIELRSWDYRALDTRQAGAASADADGIALSRRDTPGVYAYQTRAQGMRMANNELLALEASRQITVGAGTVRTLAPGTTFTLLDHEGIEAGDNTFLVVRTVHLMHNNLRADLRAAINQAVGPSALGSVLEQQAMRDLPAAKNADGERPLYRNRLDAIRANLPYRSRSTNPQGGPLHPRPGIRGQQTAIVVGPAGATVHTDRDHRIKVQFHWQRGDLAHSRRPHPAPGGHTGAPGDDSTGTWVRIATPLAAIAGANWGSVAVPRIGQEVLIDFLEDDIDRPVVVGALYNGKGQANAAHNQFAFGAGVATGNAPAWFAGERGTHAHPAALSGIKSQAMHSSQDGAGGYNQLVFDDSAGQSRTALQQHQAADKGTSELNLGHLRHQSDNQRLQPVGFGAELKTEFSAALRAGQGLLLTADARAGASGSQLDSKEAQAQVEDSHRLQLSLASTAQAHNAALKDDKGGAEPAPKQLPAIAQHGQSIEVISQAASPAGGQGKVTAYSRPLLQLSSPAGIAALTPADAILRAGNTSSITAGQDLNFASQGAFHSIKAGISLFTYGKASNKDKPNQETGIRLHAASGKVSCQSQSDATRLTADKAVTVASVTKSVTIAAKQHALLTAQGAYLKLEGGNIMVHAPGKAEFKASMKELAGPANSTPKLPYLPNPADLHNFIELNYRWDDMQPMVGAPYTVKFDDGTIIEGKLDAKGFARLENTPSRGATVTYGEDEREAVPRKQQQPNQLAGAKPRTAEEAKTVLEHYLAQEAAHYKDNFFPDELEDMCSDIEGGSTPEYAFHYDDYKYADEENAATRLAEKTHREQHENEADSPGGEGRPA